MSVRNDKDDLAAALQRIQQRGLGAEASPRPVGARGRRPRPRPTTMRDVEAGIVDLAMAVLWPRLVVARGEADKGSRSTAEKTFKATIIDELRGKSKLAQLLRALYGVDERERDKMWSAYGAFIDARQRGRLNDESAYAAAAATMSEPDAAGRRKKVAPATVKRNVMHAKAAMKGKGVAWMYGGKAPERRRAKKKKGA